jgi:hypothetical protein
MRISENPYLLRHCSNTTAEGTFGGVSDLLAELAPSLFVAAETYAVATRFALPFRLRGSF